MAVTFSHPMSRALLMGCLMTCLPSIAISQTQKSPEILHNCGYQLNLSTPPERVITVGQASTELLYRLDLHDKVIGTSNWFTDVAKEFEGVNAKVERLADNFPSFESVISKRPDLVMADFLFAVGPQGVVGTREQFQSLGITSYVLDSECVGSSSDGSPTAFRLDSLFQSIKNLAHMFNVQAKGDELIREIRGREEAAITDAQQRNLNRLSAVFWFSSADIKMDPWVVVVN
ncbi:iron compound ABC transporter, periplasmic iron compound-binding protein [Vibrio cholerae HE48]|uniref:ABC transporter substrate-binding protein n=1 Tax=Vibrio cholerae TaxID=666 RepID=UPI000218FA9D|nr:ABC transporter substrate-binding protein [Vibrio cholerae]EGR09711.1 iron compound ABC transporter, periplasmic iron compound-binding protein [Vibrio cholerae HE48]